MKALLVSLTNYEHYNYGNTLQCYAANKLLEARGLTVDTLCVEPIARIHLRNQCVRIFHKLSNNYFSADPAYWKLMRVRNRRFQKFEQAHFSMRYVRKLASLAYEYDYYVVGSDQVWNAYWYDNDPLYKDAFLLTFAKQGKKVCMMPSFGADDIPEKWKPWFQRYLPDFPMISVREEQGVKIVSDLTGQDARVLLDPTLVLEPSEWEAIVRKPEWKELEEPYILTYFLGNKPMEAEKQLSALREESGMAVYELDKKSQDSVFEAGPGEFLYLFSHAALVLTNSFHACVFSYIFHKPFLVYERQGMMSRIDTLLALLGKEERLQRNNPEAAEGKMNIDPFVCDYRDADERVKAERRKAQEFLDEALGE